MFDNKDKTSQYTRLSTMNTIEKSKKRIVFGYLNKLTEQMSSLLEIDHHVLRDT